MKLKTEALLQVIGGQTPMGSPGQLAKQAPTWVIFASQESSYAAGQVYGDSSGSGNPKA